MISKAKIANLKEHIIYLAISLACIASVASAAPSPLKLELSRLNKSQQDNLLQDSLNTPSHVRSALLEIRDGEKAEKAREIAERALLQYIQNNWTKVRQSYVNHTAAENLSQFTYELRRELKDQFIYSPTHFTKFGLKEYRFQFQDWAIISVSKDLKSVKSKVDLGTPAEGNQLDPKANEIVSD